MCLAIPGKVLKVEKKIVLEYPGELREVEVSVVDLEVGDYVIVNGGVIVSKIESEKALDFLKMME